MNDYTLVFPRWMWLYFGAFGSIGTILFTLTLWFLMKARALGRGYLRPVAGWSMAGYMFLFIAAWFACGIGGPPGNLLSPDLNVQNSFLGMFEALLAMSLSVPGWACVLVGQWKLFQGLHSDRGLNSAQSRPVPA